MQHNPTLKTNFHLSVDYLLYIIFKDILRRFEIRSFTLSLRISSSKRVYILVVTPSIYFRKKLGTVLAYHYDLAFTVSAFRHTWHLPVHRIFYCWSVDFRYFNISFVFCEPHIALETERRSEKLYFSPNLNKSTSGK